MRIDLLKNDRDFHQWWVRAFARLLYSYKRAFDTHTHTVQYFFVLFPMCKRQTHKNIINCRLSAVFFALSSPTKHSLKRRRWKRKRQKKWRNILCPSQILINEFIIFYVDIESKQEWSEKKKRRIVVALAWSILMLFWCARLFCAHAHQFKGDCDARIDVAKFTI